MNDHQTPSEISSAKKLKPSTTPTANDDMDPAINENILNNNTQTGNENVVLLHPNSSCSAEESVFSIDHLRESILAELELDRKTLINCRLVSRRWVHFSSKSLRQIITFKFLNIRNITQEAVPFYCPLKQNRPIKDLVTLMNDSTDGNFPCTSFTFKNTFPCKMDSSAQQFFNAHGHFIKKIKFEFYLFVDDLKRLLLIQAPNLEELVCGCVEWKYTKSESRSTNKSETEEECLFSENIIGPKPVFKSLKKFVCRSTEIPTIFLQQLLECSPNLVEVFFSPKYLPYLVQPVNRLHLLKQLAVKDEPGYIDALAYVANNHGGNWAVEDVVLGTHYNDWNPAMVAKAREVVRKFLEGSAATCQKLEWDDGLEDFQFPVMPGVKHFRLYYHKPVLTKMTISNFPKIERLGETFPNLRSLEVKTNFFNEVYLQDVFGNHVPAPVPSVKNVSFKFHPNPILVKGFRKMFPNAVINY